MVYFVKQETLEKLKCPLRLKRRYLVTCAANSGEHQVTALIAYIPSHRPTTNLAIFTHPSTPAFSQHDPLACHQPIASMQVWALRHLHLRYTRAPAYLIEKLAVQ